MPSTSYGSVPFPQQIDFIRQKLNIPTRHWTDIYTREHDWAFMVAGAHRDAIVADFRESIERMIADGGTLEEFRKDFDNIVAKHGWDYNGGRHWRSRVIYETNLFSSYSAGRFEQLWNDRETLPYWQYHHNDAVTHPREHHLAWDGLVLKADDPWWQAHFPPGGWGCQCYVTGLSEFDLQRQKLKPGIAPVENWQTVEIGQRSPTGPRTVRVPEGIDPGFEYTPGRARLQSAIPPERPEPPISGSTGSHGLPNTRPNTPLPQPRPANPNQLLPEGLTQEEYARAFLQPFGADLDSPVVFRDVINERLVVGADLFRNRKTGELKADKAGRGKYLPILAEAVRDPDEIWVRLEWHAAKNRAIVRRRYIAQFILTDQALPALAVFEIGADGWSGITVFHVDNHDIDNMRLGVQLYSRSESGSESAPAAP